MEHKETFMDKLNLFLVGAVVGCIIGICFAINGYHSITKKQSKIIGAYEKYYYNTEVLLDSLDGTHNLDLMDTDLCSDYGVNYLNAKSKVDSLTNSYKYHD